MMWVGGIVAFRVRKPQPRDRKRCWLWEGCLHSQTQSKQTVVAEPQHPVGVSVVAMSAQAAPSISASPDTKKADETKCSSEAATAVVSQKDTCAVGVDSFVYEGRILVWSFPKALGGWHIFGSSWACDRTAFQIPELSWAFDAGFLAHPQLRTHIFISHAHGDHCTDIVHMASRHLPPHVFVPHDVVEPMRRYIDAFLSLRLSIKPSEVKDLLPSYHLHGVGPGDGFELPASKKRKTWVEVFGCDHSVTSVGYGFSWIRRKLRAELASLSGKEIKTLKQSGQEITEVQHIPAFAFLGDTTTKVYDEHPEVFKYPVIVAECTFLREQDDDRAQKTKHSTFAKLKPHLLKHRGCQWVLIHFSHRYSTEDIRQFFADVWAKQPELRHVTPFIRSADAKVLPDNPFNH